MTDKNELSFLYLRSSLKLCAGLIRGPGTQPEIFRDKGGLMELGHSDKHFVKKSSGKKGPGGKHFEVFSLRYS